MTRLPPYSDPFWEKDASNGSAGFDALLRRCKEGRHALEEIEEFVRARSRLEEDYGKSLVKLAKSAPLKDEFGTFRSAWERQRQQTERIGRLHMDMSMELCRLADRLRLFVSSLSEQRKKASESVKKCQALKADMDKKSSASDSKSGRAKDGGSDSAASAGEGCYDTIDSCDLGRPEWLSQMDATCQLLEQMETDRGEFARRELWIMTNVDSVTCLERDLANDQTRTALQRFSPDVDLQLFISRRRPQEPADQPGSPFRASAAASGAALKESLVRELAEHMSKISPPDITTTSYQHPTVQRQSSVATTIVPSPELAAVSARDPKRPPSEVPIYEDVDLREECAYYIVEPVTEQSSHQSAVTAAAAGGITTSDSGCAAGSGRSSSGSDLSTEPPPPRSLATTDGSVDLETGAQRSPLDGILGAVSADAGSGASADQRQAAAAGS